MAYTILSNEGKDIYNKINESFENYELKNFNIDTFSNLSVADIAAIINTICLEKIKSTNKAVAKLNYKLSFYIPLIDVLVNITKKYLLKTNSDLFPLLLTITKTDKGHKYLYELESFVITAKISHDHMIYILKAAALKGTVKAFMFWKNISKISIFSKENSYILTNSIKNPDDRLFLWFLKELKETKITEYFYHDITLSTLRSILDSNIPPKFILKRIKYLSSHCDLTEYWCSMIDIAPEDILVVLMKYYYTESMFSFQMSKLVNRLFELSNIKKAHDLLKTPEEKFMFSNLLAFKGPNYCTLNLINVKTINFNTDLLIEFFQKIKILEIKSLTDLFDKSCYCHQKCLGTIMKNLCNQGYFHRINYKEIISPHLQLLTKFYSPDFINPSWIKINKLLSFLRQIAKKRVKSKMINFQYKFFPVIQEILNFTPTDKPVLRHGSLNWQNNIYKYSNIPPTHLLPNEINKIDSFLLKEKADGILINNLPINVFPKINDVILKEVKAEYIEELELYLVLDINIPNTNIIDRYTFLRNIHPSTNKTNLVCVNTMDELIIEIQNERQKLNEFIMTNESKIKWYPLASYFAKDATEKLKKDIILNIIESKNIKINNFLNKEGKYNCDGLILTPLTKAVVFRDIKIKPKHLMTIDLEYNGHDWIDKDKNKYNDYMSLSEESYTKNIYRCYPKDNLYLPIDVRYDKKHPNNHEIISTIKNLYGTDWTRFV